MIIEIPTFREILKVIDRTMEREQIDSGNKVLRLIAKGGGLIKCGRDYPWTNIVFEAEMSEGKLKAVYSLKAFLGRLNKTPVLFATCKPYDLNQKIVLRINEELKEYTPLGLDEFGNIIQIREMYGEGIPTIREELRRLEKILEMNDASRN